MRLRFLGTITVLPHISFRATVAFLLAAACAGAVLAAFAAGVWAAAGKASDMASKAALNKRFLECMVNFILPFQSD